MMLPFIQYLQDRVGLEPASDAHDASLSFGRVSIGPFGVLGVTIRVHTVSPLVHKPDKKAKFHIFL